jgi:hypothetical protein
MLSEYYATVPKWGSQGLRGQAAAHITDSQAAEARPDGTDSPFHRKPHSLSPGLYEPFSQPYHTL